MQSSISFRGHWKVEAFASLAAIQAGESPLWTEEFPNGGTTLGLNDNQNVYLGGGTQSLTWYIGLVDHSGFSAFAASDTMGAHSGWAESTAYSEGARQTFVPAAAAGGVIQNTSQATFTINTTVTIQGGFITNSATKGGTTGTLWATGAFNNPQSLINGQVLRVTYSCTATSN